MTELVHFVAARQRVKIADVDIAVLSRKEMAACNRTFLRHAGPTDVISFDLTDPGAKGLSAEILLCGDIARAEAKKRSHGEQRELLLYLIHGLLHLMGYDDKTAAKAKKMHARQEALLAEFMGK